MSLPFLISFHSLKKEKEGDPPLSFLSTSLFRGHHGSVISRSPRREEPRRGREGERTVTETSVAFFLQPRISRCILSTTPLTRLQLIQTSRNLVKLLGREGDGTAGDIIIGHFTRQGCFLGG